MDRQDALDKIEEVEKTDSAYVKIGNDASTLVVTFAGNHHGGFARKTNLTELRTERNAFDILYMRNQGEWYLGGLNGIGETIEDTIAFLKEEFEKYDKVICVGTSAGGYASILFASLCGTDPSIAITPQTDLNECLSLRKPGHLHRIKKLPSFEKYSNLNSVITDNTTYYIHNRDQRGRWELIMHGTSHYDNIKHHPSVRWFDEWKFGEILQKELDI